MHSPTYRPTLVETSVFPRPSWNRRVSFNFLRTRTVFYVRRPRDSSATWSSRISRRRVVAIDIFKQSNVKTTKTRRSNEAFTKSIVYIARNRRPNVVKHTADINSTRGLVVRKITVKWLPKPLFSVIANEYGNGNNILSDETRRDGVGWRVTFACRFQLWILPPPVQIECSRWTYVGSIKNEKNTFSLGEHGK